MNRLFSLHKHRALVTGSSQGLGLAIARGLAEAGATVLLNGRDREKLERAAAALRADNLRAEIYGFDATEDSFTIGIVISGGCAIESSNRRHRLRQYDKFLVPAGLGPFRIEPETTTEILECLPPL